MAAPSYEVAFLVFFSISKTIPANLKTLIHASIASMLLIASVCYSQGVMTPGAPSNKDPKFPVTASPRDTDSSTHPSAPGTTGEQKDTQQSASTEIPVRPAAISLRDGKLTVEANNSDLTQILQNLADISGMTIEGLNQGPRVFGIYGPGNSRDVLTALLVGSGYNFIMVGGEASGTPRKLLLTAQKGAAFNPAPQNQVKSDDDGPELDGPDPNVLRLHRRSQKTKIHACREVCRNCVQI
jgi:hypothetical protein